VYPLRQSGEREGVVCQSVLANGGWRIANGEWLIANGVMRDA